MTAPYSDDKKIEILTYAKEHGVADAARHYGIARQQITNWNKKLHVYTPQTAQYSSQQRHQVLQYAAINGVRAASKKFGVSVGIINIWNDQMHVFAPKRTTFTDAQKIEILEIARDIGPAMAADKFGINPGTLCRWNNKFKRYQPQREYTTPEIIEILTYAKDHGVIAATMEFNISKETLKRHNKIHNIYTPQDVPDAIQYPPAQQRAFLTMALGIYNGMPPDVRSANQAFMHITEKHNVTMDQLWAWNRKFKIVPARQFSGRKITRSEIDAVQHALDASRGRIAAASRKSGVPVSRITKLKKDQKVTFEMGIQNIKTNPPVGQKKAKLIGAIIGGLITKKERK